MRFDEAQGQDGLRGFIIAGGAFDLLRETNGRGAVPQSLNIKNSFASRR